ncbi:MAG: 30S ribosomal protein S18 [Verrucomicrobiae bacterium]|nr:30S ribosomal protein S18 [Verrucomicrobiae bacterium]
MKPRSTRRPGGKRSSRSGNFGAPRRRPNLRIEDIDFKNVELLRKFVTEEGKILSRKYTNLPASFQRRLAKSIKRARNMLLMK